MKNRERGRFSDPPEGMREEPIGDPGPTGDPGPGPKPNGHAEAGHRYAWQAEAEPGKVWPKRNLLLLPHEFRAPRRPRLLQGFVEHGAEMMVYGAPESGKSPWIIDLACHIAAGRPWQGHAVAQGVPIILAGEKQQSAQDRVRGWLVKHGLWVPDPARPFPVAVLGKGFNLLHGKPALDELLGEMKQVRQELRAPIQIVFGDTLHSLTTGAAEDNKDQGRVIEAQRYLADELARDQDERPAIVDVHHSGQNEASGPRGATAGPAAKSVIVKIAKEGRHHFVTCEKANDLDKTKVKLAPFTIEAVLIRREDSDEWVPCPVVEPAEIAAAKDERRQKIEAAVRMAKEGMHQDDIADALAVHQTTISRWIERHGGGPRGDGNKKASRKP